MLKGHACIDRVYAAHVLVVETGACANEDLEQWPALDTLMFVLLADACT